MRNMINTVDFRNNKRKIHNMTKSDQKDINITLLKYIEYLEQQIQVLNKQIIMIKDDIYKED